MLLHRVPVRLFVLVGRKFMAPLGQVVESVRAACDGELGHKAEVDSPDEFGVLAARTTR